MLKVGLGCQSTILSTFSKEFNKEIVTFWGVEIFMKFGVGLLELDFEASALGNSVNYTAFEPSALGNCAKYEAFEPSASGNCVKYEAFEPSALGNCLKYYAFEALALGNCVSAS